MRRQITIAAAGLALAAPFAWQHWTGRAAPASDERWKEPPSVALGAPRTALDESAEGAARRIEVEPASGQGQRARETRRLAVAEADPVVTALPRIARTTLPIPPNVSVTPEPREVHAAMPTRPLRPSIELPRVPPVSAPSVAPVRALTRTPASVSLSHAPSAVDRAGDRTRGVAADADALKTLIDMFDGPKPPAALGSRSTTR